MTGSHNLALLSQQEREQIAADRAACLIRHKLVGLKGEPRTKQGKELLKLVPSHMRVAVVERLKARSAK